MKIKLESKGMQHRGVILEAENEEETAVLMALWNQGGRPVTYGRRGDGNLEMVIAPTPPKEELPPSPRGCVCGKLMNVVIDTKDYLVWACEPTGCGRLYVEAKGEGHATWYYAERNERLGKEI